MAQRMRRRNSRRHRSALAPTRARPAQHHRRRIVDIHHPDDKPNRAGAETTAADHSENPPAGADRGPIRAASLVIGFGLALALCGLAESMPTHVGRTHAGAASSNLIMAMALAALAAGVSVPRRIAVWFLRNTWRRMTGREALGVGEAIPLPSTTADRSLHWMVLSALTVFAGILLAVLPLSVRAVFGVHAWLADRFLWSKGTLIIPDVLSIAVLLTPVFVLLGLVVSCLHYVSCARGRWDSRASAWLLIGAGAGTWIADGMVLATGSAMLPLCLAALPFLAAALLAAFHRAPRDGGGSQETTTRVISETPICSDRSPRLLRAGLVAAGGGAACAVILSNDLASTIGASGGQLTALMMVVAGIGMLAGSRCAPTVVRSIGGFGEACSWCGIVWCAMFVWLEYIGRAVPHAVMLGSLAGAGYAGYVLAYGRQTLLSRVGDRSREGVTAMTRSLLCAAVTVWPVAPAVMNSLGARAALLTLALSFLALGGILIIHETEDLASRRHARLCAIFGSVGAMVLLACTLP